MARVDGIKKKLLQHGFNEKQIKEIAGNGELVGVIMRMDEILDPDITHQILDSCGCLGSQEYRKKLEKIGKELAGKNIDEKIYHVNNVSSESEKIVLNDNNTVTAILKYNNDGKYKCVCSASAGKGKIVSDLVAEDNPVMPLTYCFCCAGSLRRHLQLQLGVGLQTKSIVSSPINSKGEKPCEFVYEIEIV